MDSRPRPRARIAGAAALAVAVVVWLAYDLATEDGGRPVAWQDLTARVGPLRITRQTLRVFESRDELERFLRAAARRREAGPPRIGLAGRRAVLVAAGPRSSTGYDLRVLRVIEHRRRIVVVVRERTPALGEPARARLTYPYRLITLTAGDKPVRLEWRGRP